jgi:CHAT domain-containing protein
VAPRPIGESPLVRAEFAVTLAQSEPRRALRTAEALDRLADLQVRAVAQRAAGLALAELHRPTEALRRLRAAVRLAHRAGVPERAGEARMSAAYVLFTMGRTRDALREADRAALLLAGPALDRLRAQRGTIHNRLGHTEAALAEYAAALPGLVRAGDRLWEARLRNNRAILYTERNDLNAAAKDLMRARQLFRELDMRYALAQIEHNLGFLAARSGAAVAALDWYARAEAGYRAADVPTTILSINRAELLLALRLPDDAVAAARRAVQGSETARRGSNLAEARLVLAEAALLAGDAAVADEAAGEALRSFRRQRRDAWALAARWVRLRAQATDTSRAGQQRLLAECRRLADQLDAARWNSAALDARILAAELAARLGRQPLAATLLAAAAAPGRRQPALTRARGLYARALACHLAGDRAGALRALGRGTRIIAEYATALGSADLRAGVAAHIADLAGLGVRIAVAGNRAGDVLRWSELGRGLTLHTRPAAPPDDGELATLLVQLRGAATEVRAATVAGADPRPVLRRQAQLEEAVRELTRRSRGLATPAAPVAADRLAELLADRTLVSYTELDGQLHAVVCADARLSLHRLGPVDAVGNEVAALLAALRRIASGYGALGVLRQRRALAERTAERLDATLLGPLPMGAAGPVVIVPTGPLHSLPWAALPSLADRAVTVVPSATLWARLQEAPAVPGGRTAVIAGPDLPGAEAEVAEVAAAAPGSRRLSGPQATVAATLAALDGARVAHVACHGDFRPGNPLFSTLRLADGPLTAYDLQRLRAVPRLLVLSACDVGRSTVTPGEGLLGLSATLLSLGAAALIAPLVAVPDETTRALMVELHRRLGEQLPAAEALRLARAALPDDVTGYATGASFVCLGGG